jgi:hypothetical protein
MNLKVLFLTYFFPPRPEIGGKRIDKMCALAINRGWQPFVLTTEGDKAVDQSLAKQYGVVDTQTIPPQLKSSLFSERPRSLGSKVFYRLFRFYNLCADIFSFYRYAKKIISDNKVPVFLSTHPPRCVQLGALFVKYVSKAFWVADFRDPWLRYKRKGFNLNRACNRFFLKRILEKADLILAVTKSNLEFLQKEARSDISSKCLLVPNAVELSLFENVHTIRSSTDDKILLGHLGDLDYGYRYPGPILTALAKLREQSDRYKKLEVHFWGNTGYWDGVDTDGLIRNENLVGSAFYHGSVDQKTAHGIIKGLDILVLLAFNQPLQVPAKTYEYLLSGKPLLALCEKHSETYAVVRQFENVVTITSVDEPSVERGIAEVIDVFRSRSRSGASRDVSKLDYNVVFAPVIDRIEVMTQKSNL